MNAARRKQIEEAKSHIDLAKSLIELASSDERDYYDAMPENMQGGDKGTAAEAAADLLDEAASELDDIMTKLEEAAA